MAGYEGESERMWDEYDWERFLQQQDHKTEQCMQLLEKYLDDPQRDQIIAREMGWTQLLDAKDWSTEVDALLDEESGRRERLPAQIGQRRHSTHSKITASIAPRLHSRFGSINFSMKIASLQNEPAAVKLATHSALASAKLAAALSDDDVDEIRMTIAYLKRALKAITISMDAAAQLLSEKLITAAQHSVLQQRLFQVRDGIITLMGEYRGEWRRRFGTDANSC